MQRKLSLGGLFLLFLLLCAIISSIQPDMATYTETIFLVEDIIPSTEDTSTEGTISREDTITREDTISSTKDTILCTAVIPLFFYA